ncbi:sigma-70 family RNA polymerase sigma factor [Aciduricibacillus chroicocephali]|uniref:Sigma-70 family RNA polymerase sigma factor n=1 Tax=Aciduricibacillus chroicocephali TaxID=3054939 RepID=A0ABY9KVQ8_9BACI|nr:sigma-70 family RNA polymerase sigma factor [Bacillaceae bacterium 44XB]
MGKITFEEIFKENERRIHYHINRMNIRDPHSDFFQEGLCALWNAYDSYKPEKGTMGTYFNFMIRNRLIDLVRKETRVRKNDGETVSATSVLLTDGNHQKLGGLSASLPGKTQDIVLHDPTLWQKLKLNLTANQWTWVRCFIVEQMSISDIARQEKTTVDAVKGWARQTRRKLRDDRFRAKIGWEV